jgi:DNA polymerase-3 subunit delta'
MKTEASDPLALHPWNRAAVERLVRRGATLPHALLAQGPDGTGKRAFVAHAAAALLCEAPRDGHACNNCRNCRLLAACAHPDFHVVEPEVETDTGRDLLNAYSRRYAPEKDKKGDRKPSRVIRIDQIRALIESMRGRPQIGSRRVAVVVPAETINVNAANSFLKLLEEPPPDTVFLLVSSAPGRLPATVRSRCVPLVLNRPARAEALAWLRLTDTQITDPEACLDLASGAPVRALAYVRADEPGRVKGIIADLVDLAGLGRRRSDLAACSARWKEAGTENCLGWLEVAIGDMLRLRLAPETRNLRIPAARADLRRLGERLNSNELVGFLDQVSRGRGLAGGPLDEQLLIEDILAAWLRLTHFESHAVNG